MASDKVVAVTDGNFDSEVLQSSVPVLLDFTAGWCQPCKAVAPIVAELAGEYEGRVKVGKVDIDEAPGTAQKYGIRGVPTLMVVKGGEVFDKIVGAVPKAKIVALVERAL